jgi:hypothetical protein
MGGPTAREEFCPERCGRLAAPARAMSFDERLVRRPDARAGKTARIPPDRAARTKPFDQAGRLIPQGDRARREPGGSVGVLHDPGDLGTAIAKLKWRPKNWEGRHEADSDPH